MFAGQVIVGGSIETKMGKLTGVLIDNGDDKVYQQMPATSKEMFTQWMDAAQKKCFEQGLTTITDCGLNYDDVEAIDALQKTAEENSVDFNTETLPWILKLSEHTGKLQDVAVKFQTQLQQLLAADIMPEQNEQ